MSWSTNTTRSDGVRNRSRFADELDRARVVRALPTGTRRVDLVEADAAGDDYQPRTMVLDTRIVGVVEPCERFLDGVLGCSDVGEHAEGQVHQVRTVRPPYLGELGLGRSGA
jgi:hypothetical protein